MNKALKGTFIHAHPETDSFLYELPLMAKLSLSGHLYLLEFCLISIKLLNQLSRQICYSLNRRAKEWTLMENKHFQGWSKAKTHKKTTLSVHLFLLLTLYTLLSPREKQKPQGLRTTTNRIPQNQLLPQRQRPCTSSKQKTLGLSCIPTFPLVFLKSTFPPNQLSHAQLGGMCLLVSQFPAVSNNKALARNK